jgi:CheY-like chemotaxis protein
LAEDGHDNQVLISTFLNKAGATVKVVADGGEAVSAAVEAAASGKAFDVVLMDMQMPVLDGYGATSLLRSEHYQGPIIALTAHAMVGDRERCLLAGCNDFITKPISRGALIDAVARWGRVE